MNWEALGVITAIALPALGGFGVLVGVIWRGQNRRIDGIEDEAREDRKHFSGTADKIFTRIETLTGSLSDFQVHVAETFATKTEIRQHQENGHRG